MTHSELKIEGYTTVMYRQDKILDSTTKGRNVLLGLYVKDTLISQVIPFAFTTTRKFQLSSYRLSNFSVNPRRQSRG